MAPNYNLELLIYIFPIDLIYFTQLFIFYLQGVKVVQKKEGGEFIF